MYADWSILRITSDDFTKHYMHVFSFSLHTTY